MDKFKVIVLNFQTDGFDRFERIIEAPNRDLAIWKIAKDLTVDPDDISVEQIVEKENKAGSNVLCTTCKHPINKHSPSGSNDGPMPCFWHDLDSEEEGMIVCGCRNFVAP